MALSSGSKPKGAARCQEVAGANAIYLAAGAYLNCNYTCKIVAVMSQKIFNLPSTGPRVQACAIHLAFSAALAAMCAALVFLLWYPAPYGAMSGVSELFLLMLGVDVVLGPLVTLVVFNPAKPRTELLRDLVVVVMLQVGALSFGLWTVFAGRPVHAVFEYDRIRMVHANEIPEEFLSRVPSGMDAFPWTGPTLLALRPFRNNDEQMSAVFAALNGIQMSVRPELWMPYGHAVPDILKAAKPISALTAAKPDFALPLQAALRAHRRTADTTVYLPLASRAGFGTALLDATTAEPVALLPLDAF